jgi:cell division transport system permease protein
MMWMTIYNSIKESINNIWRHPLVAFASISTISLMLFIMSSFAVFSMNARSIMQKLSQQPPIEIILNMGIDQKVVKDIELRLSSDPEIFEYKILTPAQNLKSFKKDMGDEQLFAGFSPDNLPYTITVRLANPSNAKTFAAQYGGMPGVNKVLLELSLMNFLSKAIMWINYASLISFVVLLMISFFIISNMIRISVFARGEEINIMKYVGATNWYINIPYIFEGVLVGTIGAVLSSAGIIILYGKLYKTFMAGTHENTTLSLLPLPEVKVTVFVICLVIGILVGSFGSALAIRRHIKV